MRPGVSSGLVLAGALAGGLLVAAGGAALLSRALRAPPPPVRVAVELAAPGRTPEEVERLVAIPVEDALAALPGLQGMESTAEAGRARVVLTLDPSEDGAAARARIGERLAAAARLPAGLPAPAVSAVEQRVAFRWVLSSATLAPLELAALEARAALAVSVEAGVAGVDGCGPAAEWRITVDPARAAARGLRATEVWRELAAPGTPEAPGAARRWTPEALRARPVRGAAGADVRLADVAQVERSAAAGGCRARGPQGEVAAGTAWLSSAGASAVAGRLEARLRALPVPAAATLTVLGTAPAIALRTAPGAGACLAALAAQLPGVEGWLLEEEGDRARLVLRPARAGEGRRLASDAARALAGCPGAAYAGLEAPASAPRVLRLRIAGPAPEALERIARGLRDALAAEPRARVLPGADEADVLALVVRSDRAAALQVDPAEVERAMALATAGVTIGEVGEGEAATPVRLRWGTAGSLREALEVVTLRGPAGGAVALAELAELRVRRERPILRQARERAVEVRIEVEPAAEEPVRRRALEAASPLPAGYSVYAVDEGRGRQGALRGWLEAR